MVNAYTVQKAYEVLALGQAVGLGGPFCPLRTLTEAAIEGNAAAVRGMAAGMRAAIAADVDGKHLWFGQTLPNHIFRALNDALFSLQNSY